VAEEQVAQVAGGDEDGRAGGLLLLRPQAWKSFCASLLSLDGLIFSPRMVV
jgi:hypothetical protein